MELLDISEPAKNMSKEKIKELKYNVNIEAENMIWVKYFFLIKFY